MCQGFSPLKDVRKWIDLIHSPINLDLLYLEYLYTTHRSLYWLDFDTMLFGCQYSAWILFAGVVLVLAQPPTDFPRQYRLKRGTSRLYRHHGFTITDLVEKQIYYKLEPRFLPRQRLEVIRYLDKKKTAEFRIILHLLLRSRAKFSILNETTNRWVPGKLKEVSLWNLLPYNIQWNGHNLKLIHSAEPRTFEFQDEDNEELANFYIHPDLWRRRTFNMTIYSNKYPEEIYFFGLASLSDVLAGGKTNY